ncbi:MAG: nucleotidyltransferase domain-containing protein [Deltaproteobacteria bacterium]|nr:nucleotidyltransferase domain-containing protein [Deltaproteobacteria bacterium]
MSEHADHYLRRFEARELAREDLRQRALAAMPALVDLLVRDFGAKRVILFGSLVRGAMSDHPDIDLLVEGIDPVAVGRAAGRLFLLAPLPVDLVPRETGRPEIVARALEEGIVLHDA